MFARFLFEIVLLATLMWCWCFMFYGVCQINNPNTSVRMRCGVNTPDWGKFSSPSHVLCGARVPADQVHPPRELETFLSPSHARILRICASSLELEYVDYTHTQWLTLNPRSLAA